MEHTVRAPTSSSPYLSHVFLNHGVNERGSPSWCFCVSPDKFIQKQTYSSAHYIKNVILIEHSPLHKIAKAISCLPGCLKQWILINQQKLNVNENVLEPASEYNTKLLIVTNFAFKPAHFRVLRSTNATTA